jgi:hypothetical protein
MNPPRLATWLLQCWGSGPNRESLAGDLIERYQHGRSRAWYWRQVVIAVAIGAARDIRDHKFLAARAAVGGFLLLWLSAYVVQTTYNAASIFIWNWTVTHGWDTARVWWFGRPRVPGFPEPPVHEARWVYSAMIGWAIARLHRRHALAMVFSCAGFLYVFNVALWLWVVGPTRFLQGLHMHPMTPIVLLSMPGVILLGGLLGSRPDHDAPDQIVIGG